MKLNWKNKTEERQHRRALSRETRITRCKIDIFFFEQIPNAECGGQRESKRWQPKPVVRNNFGNEARTCRHVLMHEPKLQRTCGRGDKPGPDFLRSDEPGRRRKQKKNR